MTCGIYMIQNLVNGKIYIGQAIDIEKRWREHKNGLNGGYHCNKHLQNAWNKDGESNFEFTIICECDESQLNTMEEYYIFELMTYDDDIGYNKTYGGDSERPTEETKRKISEATKGRTLSEEHKKKIGEANKGKIISEEQKKKIGEALKGKPLSEETKKKLSEAHKGKTFSEETKKKLSEARKGENAPMYGKHHSEDTKRKQSEAHSIPIVQIAPSTNKVINVWSSAMEAEREGYRNSNIAACCKGKRKTHRKFRWMYLKDWLKEHHKGVPKKLYFID